jgi:hypothetical protein
MNRILFRSLVVVGLLAGLLVPTSAHAQSGAKRAGPVLDIGGFKSQVFEYWKAPEKEKLEKPVIYKFVMTDKDKSAEIIVKELGTDDTAKAIFDAYQKQVKPPEGYKMEEITAITDVKTAGPKVSQLVVKQGSFTPDTPKAKEMKDVRLIVDVVEAGDKKFLVQLVGPRLLVATIQPDLDKFLADLKK